MIESVLCGGWIGTACALLPRCVGGIEFKKKVKSALYPPHALLASSPSFHPHPCYPLRSLHLPFTFLIPFCGICLIVLRRPLLYFVISYSYIPGLFFILHTHTHKERELRGEAGGWHGVSVQVSDVGYLGVVCDKVE